MQPTEGDLLRKARLFITVFGLIAVLSVPSAVFGASEDEAAQIAVKTARIASSGAGQAVGTPVLLGGRVDSAQAVPLEIRFSPRGSRAWRPLKRIRTNRKGVFLTRVKARHHGRVIARPFSGQPSDPVPVRVRSQTAVKVASRTVEVGEKAKLIARVRPGGRRPYRIVVKGADSKVIEGVTRPNGKLTAGWHVSRPGTHKVKVHVGGNRTGFGSSGSHRKVTGLRSVGASWYGPGFYGGTSACGQTLTSSTIGVAHKTLPCGTKLTIRYGDRTVKAEVIDRGPFIPGREIDLTYATKQKLGFGDVGNVLIDK